MSPSTKPEALLKTRELADRLRVRPNTVLHWVRDGVIPAVRIREKVLRFDAAQVLATLDAQQREALARAVARAR
ncbi:MAG: helix-turn-helix domain-containing protein [Phycisphaerales bacterium]